MKSITIKEALTELLNTRFPGKEEPDDEALTGLGLPLTGAAFTAYALLKKCTNGDVSAIKLLNDILADEVKTELSSEALKGLSDEELMAMLDSASSK